MLSAVGGEEANLDGERFALQGAMLIAARKQPVLGQMGVLEREEFEGTARCVSQDSALKKKPHPKMRPEEGKGFNFCFTLET